MNLNTSMKHFQHLYDNYLIRPANSIQHPPFRTHFIGHNMFDKIFSLEQPIDVQDQFLEEYLKWIQSSKLNSFTGLEKFSKRYVSVGVTQAIDDFILFSFKTKRRLRIFKGEYPYSRESSQIPWYYESIDDVELVTGDAVIISCPFSATGDKHPKWDWLINECNRLEIPVFVDAAFFGTCRDITVDFSAPCIDTVSFSPTKGLNCGNFRTGIAFTNRSKELCSLDILTQHHHGVHLHTALALELMKTFSPDTIPEAYTTIQQQVCNHYGLVPTKTMHLALGGEGWEHFTRDGMWNRIGIRIPCAELYKGKELK